MKRKQQTSKTRLSWSKSEIREPEITELFTTLSEHYPIVEDGRGLKLSATLRGRGLKIMRGANGAEIEGANVSMVARGIGALLSGLEDGISEECQFKRVGLMLDCSRNAVMKVDYLKEWLRRAALLGYNQMMLYTKDTYELPGEECFGYLRGRYTASELRELDAYAARLGMELVGCVQTLGHLEPVLRWGRYFGIRDTPAELLTTEEKSYELIDKILDFYSGAYRSRRIHLGMDETHNLGRGRYMDLNGYRRPFDIYIDHLNRVTNQCVRRGLHPMIWSDMFFRMGSKRLDYYDREAVTPPEVIAKIPPEVDLVYWDYYHDDAEFYREWIRRHRILGKTPIMASGIWTWPVFWYNHGQTVKSVRPCIEACAAEGVEEIFFTMWGDDGGYCDWSSAQAGACYAAEKVFHPEKEPDRSSLQAKFAAICGGDFQAHLAASELSVFERPNISASALLWDDPLLGINRKDKEAEYGKGFWHKAAAHYAAIEAKLKDAPRGGAGNVPLARELAALLRKKILAGLAADADPRSSTASKLAAEMARAVEKFERRYRALWYARNKTFGYEVMQIRLAGQASRWRELARRLNDLAAGRCGSIPELNQRVEKPAGAGGVYKNLATASVYL